MPPDHSPRIRRSGFSTLHNCLRCKGLSTSAGSWLGFHEEACLQSPCRPPGRQRGAGVEAWSRGGGGGVGGGAVPLEAGPGARPTTVISGLRLKAHNKRHLLPPK